MRVQSRNRVLVVAAIMIVLTSCAAAYTLAVAAVVSPMMLWATLDDYVGVQTARVMDTTVVRELHYVKGELFDAHATGTRYAVRFEVPESWVYRVRTHINGPTLSVDVLLGDDAHRVGGDVAATLFVLTALARDTYHEEAARGEVWFDGVAARTDDTVFVWVLPVEGPEAAKIEAMQAHVPAILESIELMPLD